MVTYSTHKIEYHNLVRYRNWIPQNELNDLYKEINRVICGNDEKKIGPLISCTHSTRKIGELLELDFEIMVPIKSRIPLTAEFSFCEYMCIENAMDIHIVTKGECLDKEINEVNKYIRKSNIFPKTAVYSVLESDNGGTVDTRLVFGI